MTDAQAAQIKELRMRGQGYRAIGAAVGLSRDIVRNFCKAKGMDGYARAMALNMQERLACGKACACCGKEISQPGNGRPRKFRSDKCRRAWWKLHPELIHKAAFYPATCAHCGQEFQSYGNRKRKYCSHACYIAARFQKGGTHDEGTV